MKKIVLLSLLLFTFTVKVNAQSVFAPVGSSWNYNYSSQLESGPATLFYNRDTIISNQNYKVISKAWNYFYWSPPPIPQDLSGSTCCDYILERNDSIFQAFPGSPTTIQLLYSFSQAVGDTIQFNNGAQYTLTLDSIRNVFECNSNRRVLYYTDHSMQAYVNTILTVIEGIGPIDDYLFLQCKGCVDGQNYYFDCTNITTCVYPSNSSTCTPVPFSIKEISNTISFKAYNNNGTETISFESLLCGEIIITDMLGRTTFSVKFHNEEKITFSTNELQAGVYFLSLKSDKGDAVKKIVIP